LGYQQLVPAALRLPGRDIGGDVWCNPDMDNWSHLILKIQKNFYMNGGCITSRREDETFIASMVGLSANMPAQNHAICV